MALLTTCTFDTEQNGRTKLTQQTIYSLLRTVDFKKHRMIVVDNGSVQETIDFIKGFPFIELIENGENLGTARAINKGIEKLKEGENFIKIDNDIVIHTNGWVDQLEDCLVRDERIGIIGLKRKDLWQHPLHENVAYRTYIESLPHEAGERWLNIEICPDIMGSCTMLSNKLVKSTGSYSQPTNYGFDDVDMSLRSQLAGFKNCFLPHIEIDHLETGNQEYIHWKQKVAGEAMQDFNRRCEEYKNGTRSLFIEI